MERPTLHASVRENTGKGYNRRLRASGEIPGIIYGQGKDPVSLNLAPKPLVKMLNSDFGKNTVMSLEIEGENTPRTAIIKDIQLHAWKRQLLHIDLWEITEDTPLTLEIPFVKFGVSEVEASGQVVRITRSTVKVRCTAAAIPTSIAFDMSTLPLEAVGLRISQVPMPEGVEPLFKHDYNILRFKKARQEAELELDAETGAEAEGDDAPDAQSEEGEE